MAILSTNQRLINVGDSYSAGNGIKIENNIISVTGDNAPYSAGDNIDIQDHIISGKDWSNDIEQASANAYNVTTAWVQDNYANSADMTYISAMVDTKLDTSAWSSVSGDLATESYVIMADNINYAQATAYVENQNYANKDFVLDNIDSATSGKLDSSSFASVSGDFLTTAFGISESGAWNEATNCVENNSAAWFDNQGDVEVNELVYAQSANWNEVSSKLDSTAFDTWQQGQYTNDIAGLNNLIGTKLDASSFEEASGTFYPTSNPSGFITGVDLTPYYTTAEANTLSSMLSGAIDYVSANADDPEVTNLVQTNSGVWNEVTNKLDTTAFSDVSGTFYTNDNPSGFITGVDLSNYYTKDETSGKEELADAFANIPVGDPEVNAYVTSNSASIDESTDLVQSNSSTWNDVTAYQSNSGSYITAHQSLEGLMSASLLESADGKWTAYNSIPFKAGDEFPASADEAIQAYQTNSSTYLTAHQSLDGLMSSNLLEFNAENHISSYNGSAFEDSAPTLPMTGRDGIDVQMDNGTLVLSSTLYETVTTNSANWSQNDGDAEVNAYVHNNSATIDDVVSTYQGASANYYTTADANTLSSMFSAAIDYVSANAGGLFPSSADEAIQAYQTNSASYLTAIPDDLDLNNISANNVVFKTINETFQGEVSTAITSNIIDYGWATGCQIDTNTIGYSSLDMKLSADLPITGTNYITVGVHQEYNEHFAAWKVPYDQISLMNTLKINEYSAHFQYLSNSLTGNDNITVVNVLDERKNTMSTGEANFVVSYPGVVTQPLTFSSFYTNYGNTSAMLSGAIDYVSANAGGGNPEVENYVQTNSGTIDDTVTTFQTNSSTYMVEPNLEYNAVGEISGYGSSAIAQYGAEKQWLVHDDTLVHASNSAQYALGVNLSAVAQLLGVDETVLFESTATAGTTLSTDSPITLSEDYSNFNRMRIEYRIWSDQSFKFALEEVPCRNGYFTLSHGYINGPNNPGFYEFLYGLSGNDSKLYYSYGRFSTIGQTGITTVNSLNIMGVTGIGRKN